jgi:hypothetical protein
VLEPQPTQTLLEIRSQACAAIKKEKKCQKEKNTAIGKGDAATISDLAINPNPSSSAEIHEGA